MCLWFSFSSLLFSGPVDCTRDSESTKPTCIDLSIGGQDRTGQKRMTMEALDAFRSAADGVLQQMRQLRDACVAPKARSGAGDDQLDNSGDPDDDSGSSAAAMAEAQQAFEQAQQHYALAAARYHLVAGKGRERCDDRNSRCIHCGF